jgi:hypothetical protein
MDTFQLEDAIKRDRIIACYFGGVLAADRLPRCMIRSPKCFIVNNQNYDKPGQHWVSIFLTKYPEFFDSLGRRPNFYKKEFEYFLVNHGPQYLYNTQRLQNLVSIHCGKYCLYFIYHRSRNVSIEEIMYKFGKNLKENDEIVSEFCEKVYGIK